MESALVSSDTEEILLILLGSLIVPLLPTVGFLFISLAGCDLSMPLAPSLLIYSLYSMMFKHVLGGLIGLTVSVTVMLMEFLICPEPHAVGQLMRDLETMSTVLSAT